MSGMPNNENYDSGKQGNYAPSSQLAEKYAPKIFEKWIDLGKKVRPDDNVKKPLPSPPAMGQQGILQDAAQTPSVMLPEKILEERMTQILNKTREDFLRDAQALQKQKISELELDYELKVTEVQAEYNKKVEENNNALKEKDAELDTAYKIINIQGDILTRFYAEHKDEVIKIVQDAGLSSSDLETLAKVGKPTD
jgi:hypothetical protein